MAYSNSLSQRAEFSEILVVAIDDESLSRIPEKYPWNRRLLARVLKNLKGAGAKVIGVEEYFQSPSNLDREQDVQLGLAMKQAGNVVCQNFFQSFQTHKGESKRQISPPIPEIRRNASRFGYLHYPRDAFQRALNHSIFLKQKNLKMEHSFEIELILEFLSIANDSVQAKKDRLTIPAPGSLLQIIVSGPENQIPVYIPNQTQTGSYQPKSAPFKIVSFVDVLEGKVGRDVIEGKLVLIGATTDVSQHTYVSVMNLTLPRVLLSAHQVGSLLRHKVIRTNPWLSEGFLLFLALVVAVGCASLLTPTIHAAVVLSLYTFLVGFDLYLFHSYLLDTNMISGAILNLIILLTVTAARYFAERAEKAEIRYAFSHYVTASVVNEILKDTSMLKLGGERRQLTVFFSDIQGFTTISETLEIERLVTLLNEYLTAMTDSIIFDHGGMLDKYEGDAIMAIFGAPLHVTDHSYQACCAALDNQRILRENLWKKWRAEKYPLFRVRIGVNTGTMLVGNMGSRSRFDYTVVGDNVNVGARLENLNKLYGTDILVSEATYMHAKDRLLFRLIDSVKLKGKTLPLEVYELLGTPEGVADNRKRLNDAYAVALQAYQGREFSKASIQFQKAYELSGQTDHASLILRDRSGQYDLNPPTEEWDGSFNPVAAEVETVPSYSEPTQRTETNPSKIEES
jgi:adenylate cyclase